MKIIIKKSQYKQWPLFPAIVLISIFILIPSLIGAYYSFFYWNMFTARFCGLANYIMILTDSNINICLKNTFLFTAITTFFKVLIGLLLAIFLNRQFKTTNFLRTVYFVPCIISNVAIGLIFNSILYPGTGLLDKTLNILGLGFLQQNWLTDPNLAIYSVSGIEIWKWSGFTMIILLAGLQTISNEYYEAALIDGANSWQKFTKITMPLLMPAFNNAVLINLIGGLKIFDIVYATTQGGPGNATNVLNTLIFDAFSAGRDGEACAGNIILLIIVGSISIATYLIIRKKEVEL